MSLTSSGHSFFTDRSHRQIRIFLLVAILILGFSAGAFSSKVSFEPSCRSAVNITINPNLCYAHIRASSLLLGDYKAEEYTVAIFDQQENSLGDTIPGIYAGQTVRAEINHTLSDFNCTSFISVYDLNAPILDLPENKVLACTEEPDLSVTGTATASDCTPVTVTYEDQWTETLCGNPKITILRIWTAADIQGFTTIDTQYIEIVRASAEDLLFPPDLDYTCTEYLADTRIIEATGQGSGIPTLVNNPRCGLIYTYQDQRLSICGEPENSFLILRKWTVLDACGNTIFEEDGAGNDNTQIIRVLDKTAPIIEPILQDIPATVRKEDNGFSVCSSVGFIPAPKITDECNMVTIRIFSAVGELDYVNGVDGAEGGYIPFPGLTLGGPHEIFYEAVDACGNSSEISTAVTVIDNAVPIMLCDKNVTVSLSLNGSGRLEPFMIDEGVRDNCCLDKLQIKWVNESILSFRDRINIYCAAEPRQAILRAWDCQGNFNDCTTTVTTHDPLPATIKSVPPEVVEVNCGIDRSIYADPQYQSPIFEDNCPMDIQFTIRDSINTCGTADLWREWTLQDHPDHQVLRVSQLVHFIDEEAPLLSVVPLAAVCDPDGDCRELVRYPLAIADNCSEDLTVTHRFSLDGGAFVDDPFGQLISEADGLVLEGTYPIGEHEIFISVTDPCGNSTNGRYPLIVKDCTPPELVCREDQEFFIGEDRQLVLFPEDFVEIAEDACNDLVLSFADTEAENKIYDCDSLGLRQVSIWATDSGNNRSKCTVNFSIFETGGSCQPLGRLQGRIVNPAGEGIELVIVNLNGPDTLQAVTGADGHYRFEGVPLDTDYELAPSKAINPGNGVSVLDIIRLSRHILGLDYLTDPYAIIAADVNKSGNVTTLDIISARRVILGLSENFAGNPDSWRFLPDGYIFMDPERPLQERVPENVNFKLVLEETTVDFIGIKYGDVNGSADPKK